MTKKTIKLISNGINLVDSFSVSKRTSMEALLYEQAIIFMIKAKEIKTNEIINSIISILLSQNSLEAYINFIGIKFYGEHPDENKRKKWWKGKDGNNPMYELSLFSKINHLIKEVSKDNPKINQPRSLPKQITNDIKSLVELRKSIVHYKATAIDSNFLRKIDGQHITQEEEKYTYEAALFCVKTVYKTINEFNEYSKVNYGRWINDIIIKHNSCFN